MRRVLSQVGHAIRIAQMEGLHTQLPEEDLGAATVARCRNLWWTLYIMDRHVSSSLGLPMTRDSDITTLVNAPSLNHQDLTFSLQVRLSRMLSFIIGGKILVLHANYNTSNIIMMKPSTKRKRLS